MDDRFSFTPGGQGILPGTYEATPMEMAAQFASIDRSQIRRHSIDMEAPKCRVDRNEACRIIVRARVMERETYKRRARYQHRGVLGDLALGLLELLMNFGRKYGQIFPDYDTLASQLRKDPEAVVEAMKRLVLHGFVTKHRRSKFITTPMGKRRVQDSNAYEVHMPAAGLAIVPLITRQSSSSENPSVSALQQEIKKDNLAERPESDRFWLTDPWRMADGTVC